MSMWKGVWKKNLVYLDNYEKNIFSTVIHTSSTQNHNLSPHEGHSTTSFLSFSHNVLQRFPLLHTPY